MFALWGLTWLILQQRLKSPHCASVSPHCRHRMMDTFCGFLSPLGGKCSRRSIIVCVKNETKSKHLWDGTHHSALPFLLWQHFQQNFMSVVMRSRTCLSLQSALERGKLCLKCSSSETAQRIPERCFIWYQLSLSELIQFIMQPASSHNNPTQYASMSPGPDCEEERPPGGAWSDWPWAVCCVLL